MPRVAITPVNTFNRSTGVSLPVAAFPGEINGDATNDHEFANDGRTILVLRNSSGATIRNAEVEFARGVDGRLPDPVAYALPVSSCTAYGPWPVDDYGNVVKVNVDHADIKLALMRLP